MQELNMESTTTPQWKDFLRYFGEKNEGRPTRLGVFENGNDYWLEDGLPLTGVDLDPGKASTSVQIMLGNFTHTVRDVSRLTFHMSNDGNSDGVDVTDADGKVSMLRFEKYRPSQA
ncbi:MAG TPA: DUF5335 family protein [Pyrinomonadaceae bacterium]|nr:DUF5335 family protein [Pyrinomonadaceae bacterium]